MPPVLPPPPHKRQGECLGALVALGGTATTAEVARAMGYSGPQMAVEMLQSLAADGLVARNDPGVGPVIWRAL